MSIILGYSTTDNDKIIENDKEIATLHSRTDGKEIKCHKVVLAISSEVGTIVYRTSDSINNHTDDRSSRKPSRAR